MPDNDDLNPLDSPVAADGASLAWHRRVPVASALFLVGLTALIASILVARPAARSDRAAGRDSGSADAQTASPSSGPTPATPTEPAAEVLGEAEISGRVAITAALTADAVTTPLASTSEAEIAEGAVRAGWRIAEIPAHVGADRGFASITVDITAGAIAFAPGAVAVIEIRCVRGACADWRSWTPLPAGIVTERSATTLVPRADFVGIEAIAVRMVRDPGSYTTP